MTSSISRWVRATRCGWPTGIGGAPGQGDVDAVGDELRVELGRAELLAAGGESRLELAPGLVGGAADLAPFLLRQLGDPAQDRRSARLCGRGSGPAAPPARRWCRRPRSPPPPRPGSASIRSSIGASFIRAHAIAAAAATFSDSAPPARRGIVAVASQAASDLRRQPLALGAEADGRGAVERLESGLAAVGDERDPRRRGRRRARRPAAAAGRRSSPCWPAAPSARRRRRSRGRGRRCRRAARRRCGRSRRRCRGRRRRAGRRRARRRTASPRGRRPRPLPDRDRPRPRAEPETPASSSGSTSSPLGPASTPAPAATSTKRRLGPARQPRLEQILALGREQPLALAALPLAQLADQFQLRVVV